VFGRVPVKEIDKEGEEVDAGDLPRAVLCQRHGLSPGAAADIGDAGSVGEGFDEAECFQRYFGTSRSLSFKVGEIFTDQVEVEVVYGNVFVAHDVFE